MRGGDAIHHYNRPAQRVEFDDGLYFNAGAARIPSSHRLILDYARRFGVPMEVMVNGNRGAGWDFSGRVLPERRMVYGMQGRIGELLAKAIDQHSLDKVAPKGELEMLRQFLSFYAGLDGKGIYRASSAAGFTRDPGGYGETGAMPDPLTLKELMPSRAIGLPFVFETIFDMQAPMLQAVGGMDRIAAAIYAQVTPTVRLNTPVSAIRRAANGVRIEQRGGSTDPIFASAAAGQFAGAIPATSRPPSRRL